MEENNGSGLNVPNPGKTLHQKVNDLRADVLSRDWKDDKMLTLKGSGGYSYLSCDKVKKNVAPLFARHGLELMIEFTDLNVAPSLEKFSQHWTVRLTATIIDADTGESTSSSVYGEASDNGDKGINKAQTGAIKQWLTHFFLIADGVNPEADDEDVHGCMSYSRTAKETEEVKSKVRENAIPVPAAAKQTPPPKIIREPSAVGDAAAIAPVSDTEPVVAAPKGYNPTIPQVKAMEKILDSWKTRAENGDVTSEQYNEMSLAYAEIACSTDVMKFIRKFRVI